MITHDFHGKGVWKIHDMTVSLIHFLRTDDLWLLYQEKLPGFWVRNVLWIEQIDSVGKGNSCFMVEILTEHKN